MNVHTQIHIKDVYPDVSSAFNALKGFNANNRVMSEWRSKKFEVLFTKYKNTWSWHLTRMNTKHIENIEFFTHKNGFQTDGFATRSDCVAYVDAILGGQVDLSSLQKLDSGKYRIPGLDVHISKHLGWQVSGHQGILIKSGFKNRKAALQWLFDQPLSAYWY